MDANFVSNILIWSLGLFFVIGGIYNVYKIFHSVHTAIPDQMPDIVTRSKPTFKQRWLCRMGRHEWVARVELDGKPNPKIVNSHKVVTYFLEFAAPVCKHCPMQLPPRG